MKKAIFILFSISIFATLGGIFAFKTNFRTGPYLCTTYTSTLDQQGLPITCSVVASIGNARPLSGRCAFTVRTTTGSNCNLITRWGVDA